MPIAIRRSCGWSSSNSRTRSESMPPPRGRGRSGSGTASRFQVDRGCLPGGSLLGPGDAAAAVCGDPQGRRPGGNVLPQLLLVDLVERVVRGVMKVEVACAVLVEVERGDAGPHPLLDVGAAFRRAGGTHDAERRKGGREPIAK